MSIPWKRPETSHSLLKRRGCSAATVHLAIETRGDQQRRREGIRVRREDIGRVGSSKSPAHVRGCVSHVRTNRVRSSAHVVTQRGGDVRYRVGKTIGKE